MQQLSVAYALLSRVINFIFYIIKIVALGADGNDTGF